MKLTTTAIIVAISLFSLIANAAPTTQEAEAIACYRTYAATVRVGKIEDVVKLVEPVPATSQPLLTARLRRAIAIEAVKTEMLKQMPTARQEFWEIGGLPHDDLLKAATAVADGDNTIVVIIKEPVTNADAPAAWLSRRNGKWIVPASLVMDLEPAPQFIEPDAGARQELLRYAEANAKAAETVLKQLQNKELKKPSDVLAALAGEMAKAAQR